MKPGTKLKSTTCDTEVMVIKGSGLTVLCGGQPMADDKPAELQPLDGELSGGTLIGKRYVNADGSVELLCVKAGKGSLSIDGEVLQTKDAKPLPSSD